MMKKSSSEHHRTTLSGYVFATKAYIDNRKKLLVKQQYLLQIYTVPHSLCSPPPLATSLPSFLPPFLSLPPSTVPPFVPSYLLPYLTLPPVLPGSLLLTALGVFAHAAGFAAARRCLRFLFCDISTFSVCVSPTAWS